MLDTDTPRAPDGEEEKDEKKKNLGTLRGHLARANPQAKALIDALVAQQAETGETGAGELSEEVLILFNAPESHYVTPKFYTETKPSTGKVVPTWNYAAVQVYGKIRVYADSKSEETGEFLQRQIEDLSEACETGIMGYTKEGAWKVDDAPDRYVDVMKRAIMGVEITIERLEGKWKMSQEMGVGDREGVVRGFEGLGSDVARDVARLVRERGEMKEKAKMS